MTNQPNRPGRPPERVSRPIPRQAGGGGTYGSASVRPATPPAKPVRTRKNGRSPLWTKLVIILGALLMFGSGTVYATFKVGEHELDKALPQTDMSLGDAAAPPLTGKVKDGPLNILIVGVDASGERTDSIIIAHVPATHDRLYMVSLPRDTQVRVPSGGTNKINSTFNSGMGNLAKTIKLNYGITFNAALTVNFDGFKDLVTKLGGVDMTVDETTYSIHHGYVGTDKSDHAAPYKINPNSGVPECPHGGSFDKTPDKCTLPGIHEVVYPKGPYHFDAYDALDFVRCRDGLVGTDYARQRHQQQFMKAMMQEAYSQGLSDPTKLLGFLSSMSKAFKLDREGMSLTDWIFTLKDINPSSMITIKTNDGDFVSVPSDGHGSEQGLSADTKKLLNAVRDDNGSSDPVAEFLQTHPTWQA